MADPPGESPQTDTAAKADSNRKVAMYNIIMKAAILEESLRLISRGQRAEPLTGSFEEYRSRIFNSISLEIRTAMEHFEKMKNETTGVMDLLGSINCTPLMKELKAAFDLLLANAETYGTRPNDFELEKAMERLATTASNAIPVMQDLYTIFNEKLDELEDQNDQDDYDDYDGGGGSDGDNGGNDSPRKRQYRKNLNNHHHPYRRSGRGGRANGFGRGRGHGTAQNGRSQKTKKYCNKELELLMNSPQYHEELEGINGLRTSEETSGTTSNEDQLMQEEVVVQVPAQDDISILPTPPANPTDPVANDPVETESSEDEDEEDLNQPTTPISPGTSNDHTDLVTPEAEVKQGRGRPPKKESNAEGGRKRTNLNGSRNSNPTPKRNRKAPARTPSRIRIKKVNRIATLMCIKGADFKNKLTPDDYKGIAEMVGVDSEALNVHSNEVYIKPSVQPVDHEDYRRVHHWSSQQITPTCTDPDLAACHIPGEEDVKTLKTICEPRLTGELHVDLQTVTAEDIKRIVEEKGVRGVYTPRGLGTFPIVSKESEKVDTTLYLEELKKFEKEHGYTGHKGLTGKDRLRSPATVIQVTDNFDFQDPNVKKWVTEAPLAVIRGMLEKFKLDRSVFTPEALLGVNEDAVINVSTHLIEPPQQTMHPETGDLLDFDVVEKQYQNVPLKKFVEYYKATQKISEEGVELIKGPNATPEAFDEITEKLINAQQALFPDQSKLLKANFAINVNINEKCYDKQNEEIKKLPDYIQAKTGLLQSDGLNCPGITTVQTYPKVTGCRTYSHVEDCNLASINANVGENPCLWYVVAYEHADRVAKLMEGLGRNRTSYEALWPLEKTIREAGIPIQTVIQQPGDVVHVAPGSFHWVESLGFTVNVSWNVGQLTNAQLQAAAIYHDHCIDYKKGQELKVPLEDIVWDLAAKQEFGNCLEMAKTMKAIMVRGLARAEHENCCWMDGKEKKATRWVSGKMSIRRCKVCKRIIGNTMFKSAQSGNEACYGCKGVRSEVFVKKTVEELRSIFTEFCQALPRPLPENPTPKLPQPEPSQPSTSRSHVPITSNAPEPAALPSAQSGLTPTPSDDLLNFDALSTSSSNTHDLSPASNSLLTNIPSTLSVSSI